MASGTENIANLLKGNVELNGVVVKNIQDCVVDGPCFIEVLTEKGKVLVDYGPMRGRKCFDKEVFDVGSRLKKGDRVFLYGYSKGGASIVMCGPDKYFIRVVNG